MAPGFCGFYERSFEVRTQHDRLARPSRRGDRRYGGERLLDDLYWPGRCGRRDHGRAVRSVETHEGANALFAALPIGAAATVDVKIDETRQNIGPLRSGALRQHFACDGGDRAACKFHLADRPSVGCENSAFWRCERIRSHQVGSTVSPKRSARSSGAFPLPTSQQPVSASTFGSRMGGPPFRKPRAQRRDETARREKRRIRTRDHADQRRKMLDRAFAYSPGHRIARIGLFEDQRGERGQAIRSQAPHPALAQLVDAADRAENGAAETVLRHDAVERGKEMTQRLLADPAAAAAVAGDPAPCVALNRQPLANSRCPATPVPTINRLQGAPEPAPMSAA